MRTTSVSVKGLIFFSILFFMFASLSVFADEQAKEGAETQLKAESEEQAEEKTEELGPLYSAGPWAGRVIDAESGKPIEGAVVTAIWTREFDIRFTTFKDFHEAKEVLTDSNGYFEIPAYTETGEEKESWPRPRLSGFEEEIKFFIEGPVINDPEVIIYKPGYNYYPGRAELMIFASKASTVEYNEFYIGKINDEEIGLFRKSVQEFPEGLVYAGAGCFSRMKDWMKNTNFRFGSFLYPMNESEERIKKLDIPLECPKKVKPIPVSPNGFRNDLENPFKKGGGYVVMSLSRAVTKAERLKAIPEKESRDTDPEKIPLLNGLIQKDKEDISKMEEPKP